MKKLVKYAATCGLLAAIGLAPLAAQAESDFDSGATPLSAAARLNLRVVIPQFLYFRVGTAGATIDQITFSPTGDIVGDSTAVSGSSTAAVTVRANGGQISIAETNDGGGNGLNGTSSNISLSEITASSNNSDLDTPTLTDAGGSTADPTLNGGNVTSRSATWSYSYANTTVPEADNYDVEITYTATIL